MTELSTNKASLLNIKSALKKSDPDAAKKLLEGLPQIEDDIETLAMAIPEKPKENGSEDK